MFYYFLLEYIENYSFLNLFKYLTFRAGGALFTAFTISFLFGPFFIKTLKKIQKNGQPIRKDGPQSHLESKTGTPTMGGMLILLSLFISIILWVDLTSEIVWLVFSITILFGLIGAIDDYKKIKTNSTDGIKSSFRLLIEFVIAFTFVWLLNKIINPDLVNLVFIPYTKGYFFDLGLFYYIFAAFVIVGSANAVNLTDGLDGLAIGPIMITALSFAFITYFTGNYIFSDYLKIPFVSDTGELVIICAALIGSGLGFLWYNAPPAMVFMGDTGSLSVGGTIGAIAIATKHEIILAIIGGIFVLETMSVFAQVISFKLTGKRIFRMAPIHHHFEQKGWSESTIVIRFWIISVILALIGLASLKLR
ncbi:MAG: phospho-N-acetylmuramoyl-pentapeptide-transferase [Rickettsiales bacterium]|nr:phospho-N-acetylmuramoyl-pentapeptide-transferase [Rickettsiales bacterium]|tara:strand:+ start:6413 stop:7501 length:1089 start_codon:yes stop_codon:yes gene_type:complete